MKKNLIFILLILPLFLYAVNKEALNTFEKDSLLTLDYSTIWLTEQDNYIGFIGDNYQRFYIRFLSIEQDSVDKLQYVVAGKTMVNNVVCDFKGKIIIDEVRIFKTVPRRKAVVRAHYYFEEDPLQKNSGVLNGSLTSYVYWKDDQIVFDDLGRGISDLYHNNQFEGKWTDHITKRVKKCNWGIDRIPDSKELDMGAGEFSPNPLYEAFGWDTYPDGSKKDPPYDVQLQNDRKRWW